MTYAPFLLELIHSGGGGFYVKNGEVKTASYYGNATVQEHYNHVHVAATLSGLAAAKAKGTQATLASTSTSLGATGKGCLVPAMVGAFTVASALGSISWVIVR